MGLFDKKYCDICGSKIGLLGNRKLEDGNMCKDCASAISPWLTDRRRTTVAEMKEHLASREANKAKIQAFRPTETYGNTEHPYLIYDSSSTAWTLVRVDEAVKNSKLRAGSADYYGGESNGDILMEVEYQVSYMLADNTSFTKNSNQYYIKEAALSYHDQAVYDYFKKTFPDLFED